MVSTTSPSCHDFGQCLRPKTRAAQQGAGGQANEAVTPKTLATHHGFQQKAVAPAVTRMRQLEVQGQRGFQVGKGFRNQGDAVEALGGQTFEFKFGDHMSLHSSAPQGLCS